MNKKCRCRYEIVGAIILAAIFLIEIYPIVFTVHDDILTYAIVRHEDLWKAAKDNLFTGRLPQLWNTLLLGFPMLMQKVWFYKGISYITLLFDGLIFYRLIERVFGNQAAVLTTALFWGLASVTNQHSLFVSYVLARQIVIGILLLSIYFFIDYYYKSKVRYLWYSSFLYLAASMLYEAAVPFGLIFLLIALGQDVSWKKKVLSIVLPGGMVAIWLVLYFGWQAMCPTEYDGGTLYFGNILGSLWAVFMYSLGSFPVYSLIIVLVKGHVRFRECTFPIMGLVAAGLTSAMWYRILPRIQWDKRKRRPLVITGVSIFLPNLILGFTPKYLEWSQRMIFTYLTTFYSYFFLIAFGVIGSAALYQVCRRKREFLVMTTVAVFLTSLTAGVNNGLWKEEFHYLDDKNKAFDEAVSSAEFLQYESGTNVYIPDYIGIIGNMEYTQYYSQLYTDKTYEFRNKKEDLDFNQTVIEFRYIPEEKRIEIIELNKTEAY